MSETDKQSVIPAQAGIHPVVAYIALGANLGNAVQTVRDAIQAIKDLPETEVTKQSSLYKTAAIESLPSAPKSPDYINAWIWIFCCTAMRISKLKL
ncbi:MAG: hypothetical protein RI918_2248 [Pseudomonadota bacterium]